MHSEVTYPKWQQPSRVLTRLRSWERTLQFTIYNIFSSFSSFCFRKIPDVSGKMLSCVRFIEKMYSWSSERSISWSLSLSLSLSHPPQVIQYLLDKALIIDEDTLYELSLKIEPRLPAWRSYLVPENMGISWRVCHTWHGGDPEGQRLPWFTTTDGTRLQFCLQPE